MEGIAKLLCDPSDYPVVQLPGGAFPGVVFQGDSIHTVIAQLKSALNAARKHADDELNAELEDALELLSGVQNKLKSVCEREGLALPWPAD